MDRRRLSFALGTATVLVVASALALSLYANRPGIGGEPSPSPSPSAEPSVDLGIFAPVAGRIVFGDETGIWGVDPAAPRDRPVRLTAQAGEPLGWSSDGTRLLITRDTQLFILHADGTENNLNEATGSASISPDGSRVMFAEGGAMYGVDADGGTAELLLEAGDIWGGPSFSPDGMRIAYAVGAGDHSHSVWLMNADGSNAHQIVANDVTLRPGHVRGLAWSPAGDLIALGLEGNFYTFAPDGSDFTQIAAEISSSANSPYFSPDGSQIAYTVCLLEPVVDGCSSRLKIADADGSNEREFGYGRSGPWHPGTLENGAGE